MKFINKSILVIILICIMLSLVSCNSKTSIATTSYKDMQLNVENHINYLTSEACDGRLIGTDGNVNAQNYIRYCLEQYNITPYADSYNSQFSYNCTDINKVTVKLNGKTLKQDTDYQIKSVFRDKNQFDISENLSKDNNGKIIMFEHPTSDDLIKFSYDHNFDVVLTSDDIFYNKCETINKKIDWVEIVLKSDIYNSLQNEDKLDIEYTYEDINKTDNNLVGIIKSNQQTTNAIVLSAHFDHIGSIDNNLFCGALDNASGTACLLDLAQNLSTSIDTSKLNCDIIFAFFNAEEGGLVGSKEFAKQISQQYTNVININFDCVGGKEHDAVVIDYENDNLQSIFDKISNQFEYSKRDSVNSDHTNFSNGIGITTYNSSQNDVLVNDNIHTPLDTLDNVNTEFIRTLVDKFESIIIDLSTDEHTFCIFENDDALWENLFAQAELLNFGEYKYMKIGDSVEVASKLRYETKEKSNIEYFIGIDSKLDFTDLTLTYSYKVIPVYNSNYEMDTVYKIDLDTLSYANINNIYLSYVDWDKNENFYLYVDKYDIKNNPYTEEFLKSEYKEYTLINKDDVEYLYNYNGAKNEVAYIIKQNDTMYIMSFKYFKSNGDYTNMKYEEISSDDMFKMMDEYQIVELLNNIKSKIEDK